MFSSISVCAFDIDGQASERREALCFAELAVARGAVGFERDAHKAVRQMRESVIGEWRPHDVKYFTRGWANGELEADEEARVANAYQSRLRELADRLPSDLARLARLGLHDGIINWVRWSEKERRLQISIVGVREREYFGVELVYRDVLLGAARIQSLRNVARDRETTLHYHEVDMMEDGALVHRLLFDPAEELTLEFRELELSVTSCDDSRVRLSGYFIDEGNSAPDMTPMR